SRGRLSHLICVCDFSPISLVGLIRLAGQDRLPVENGIPQETLIAAVQVAVDRIEIEGHHVAAARGHIEYGGTSDESGFAPSLATYHEWRTASIAPLHNNVAAVFGAIEAGSAIGHPQPVPRHIVKREVLAEYIGLHRITVGQRMIGLIESHAHMCTWGSRRRLLRCCGGIGSTALRTARHTAGGTAYAAYHASFQRKHGPAAQSHEQAAFLDEVLKLRKT